MPIMHQNVRLIITLWGFHECEAEGWLGSLDDDEYESLLVRVYDGDDECQGELDDDVDEYQSLLLHVDDDGDESESLLLHVDDDGDEYQGELDDDVDDEDEGRLDDVEE